MGFLVKKRNLGQKSEFTSKIGMLVKNRDFGKYQDFRQKSGFWSNRNFLPKS